MRLVCDDLRSGYDHLRRCGVGAVDAALLAKLGHDLRSMYIDVLAPAPEELVNLIDRFSERAMLSGEGNTTPPN